MRNIKLCIEYDGTAYAGWQRQENGRTIQGELQAALKQLLQAAVSVHGAGRTDAGVHARGQVANFKTDTQLQLYEINNGLNALLPDDIIVNTVEDVPLTFHARYSAKERSYSYTITRSPSALMRHYFWYVKYDLHLDAMRWAAASTIGEHDFESFCRAQSDVDHHRCIVTAASWQTDGMVLRFDVRANRFLHGMVRALVGTMVDVGRGYMSLEEFVALFEKKERSEAGMSAPAHGLVLETVTY